MDEALRITLPSFIGILISTPIMLMTDLSKQDQTTIFFILLPMMVGAMASMVIAFRSMSPRKGDVKNEQ